MSYTIEVSLYKDDEESHVLESFHRGAEDLEEAYNLYIEAVASCRAIMEDRGPNYGPVGQLAPGGKFNFNILGDVDAEEEI